MEQDHMQQPLMGGYEMQPMYLPPNPPTDPNIQPQMMDPIMDPNMQPPMYPMMYPPMPMPVDPMMNPMMDPNMQQNMSQPMMMQPGMMEQTPQPAPVAPPTQVITNESNVRIENNYETRNGIPESTKSQCGAIILMILGFWMPLFWCVAYCHFRRSDDSGTKCCARLSLLLFICYGACYVIAIIIIVCVVIGVGVFAKDIVDENTQKYNECINTCQSKYNRGVYDYSDFQSCKNTCKSRYNM